MSGISSLNDGEAYWPNIKNAILYNPTGQPSDQSMAPQCPICLQKFSITTFRRPSGEALSCVVLFCGHVICRGCLQRANEAGVGGPDEKCPSCRTPLACTRCGQPYQTFTLPKAGESPDAVFEAPLTKSESSAVQPECHNCAMSRTASREWLNRIDNGDLPREAETIEPGAVRFVYGTADALESEGRSVTQASVSSAFASVVNEEFQTLMTPRNDYISQRASELGRESENQHFGRRHETIGQDRPGSAGRRHEHRCRALNRQQERRRENLDPPNYYSLYPETRPRRSGFEEHRRMHDRLPQERGLQDQFGGLNMGGGQCLDPFGRPLDAMGGGQGLDPFGGPLDAGNPYTGGGRGTYPSELDPPNPFRDGYGNSYELDTGSRFPGTQLGRDVGMAAINGGFGRHEIGRGAFPDGRNTGNPYTNSHTPAAASDTRRRGDAGRYYHDSHDSSVSSVSSDSSVSMTPVTPVTPGPPRYVHSNDEPVNAARCPPHEGGVSQGEVNLRSGGGGDAER
ncbi:hypothetical protein N0V84_009156 [Fusarium piperis]|uniref:RING-type domain-containing protein n=1 Tax=Fusarium piperis TaxID=1435070 RepID=A0A9W8W6R8_9HYPO|nr:hypothetical protein N0V84_009156 [Fusarium piperis]